MLKSWMRAGTVAVFGICAVLSANANGQVEDARALLTGHVKEALEDSVEYLEKFNTEDGRTAVEQLLGRVRSLESGVSSLQANAAALSPALGETWKPTATAVITLLSATEVVLGKVGREQVDLSYLKSAYETANSELERAYATSKDVGRAYVATFNLVDNAKALYGDGVSNAYKKAVDLLNASNTVDGKPAMEELTNLANRLVALSQLIKDGAEDVSPNFLQMWMDGTYYDLNLLAIEAGYLSGQIGRGQISLDKLEDAFEDSGSGIEKSFAAMKAFGENFTKLCDTCR